MKKTTSELKKNIPLNDEAIRILLVSNCQIWELRQELESTGEFGVIGEVKTDDSLITRIYMASPDIVIFLAGSEIPAEIFIDTLKVLQKVHLNMSTIILTDNPTKYFEYALKTGVAALLYREIDLRDLTLIIREVYSWSPNLPDLCDPIAGTTNRVLRLHQEVQNM